MLGYGNIEIGRSSTGRGLLILSDTSYSDEIANLLEQPWRDFTGLGTKDRAGRYVLGHGFSFRSVEEAEAAAEKIVKEIYAKH